MIRYDTKIYDNDTIMKGYAYIENGIVVVNEKRKPIRSEERIENQYKMTKLTYNKALSAWNDSCIKVENSDWVKCENPGTLEIYEQPIIIIDSESFPIIGSSQPVSFTKGKKAVITSINN